MVILYQDSVFFFFIILVLYLNLDFLVSLSSGDTDSVVPVTATRYSIDALKLPTVTNWHPWYDNGKVGTSKEISRLEFDYALFLLKISNLSPP